MMEAAQSINEFHPIDEPDGVGVGVGHETTSAPANAVAADGSLEAPADATCATGQSGGALPDPTAQSTVPRPEAPAPDPDAVSDAFEADDSLFAADARDRFASQWAEIQAAFVDHPHDSVEQADALVVDVMQRVISGFSNEREHLEAQWQQPDGPSTEDLRVALTRYRSFFNRLLSA